MATAEISLTAGSEIWSSLPDTPVTPGGPRVGWTNKNDEIRGLYKADITSLAGATITEAKLHIYVSGYTGETGGTWYVYRIRAYGGEPDASPWYYTASGEATGTTWNSREHNPPTSIAWTTAGANSDADDKDITETGASEDNPIAEPEAETWWNPEVTGGVAHALSDCGGYYACRISGVIVLGEGESAYATFGSAHLDVTYTPAAAANIKKISGVDWANVKKVTGVAEASIKGVSGVTAN